MLTPRDYVDRERYELEVERVLRRGWLPACRADQVGSPGDRFAVTLAGTPLVVTRSREGELHVLGNVCQHRGAQILDDGASNDATILCPYHRWAYRADGTLVGGPMTEGLDLGGVCLPRIRHAVWEGFVLVDLAGDAPDPASLYAGLSAELAPWSWSDLVTVGSTTFRSDWNWKVMVENWIECYHHIGSHRTTVEPFQPARTTKIVGSEGAPWTAMTVDTLGGIEGDPDEWIPSVPAERGRDLSVWAAFPLLLGGSNARYAFWLHVVPHDVDRHDVTWYVLAHRDQLHRFPPDRVARELEILSIVHSEDMDACRRVQTGLASGLLDEFRLTRLESTIAAFHAWIATTVDSGTASLRR